MKSKLIVLSDFKDFFSKVYILIAFLLAASNFIYAQTAESDSLHALLATATSDLERASLMNNLSRELRDVNLKQALTYGEKALDLSRKTDDKKNQVIALHNVGQLLYDSPEKKTSFAYFQEGEQIAAKFGLHKLQSDHLMSIAKYHRYVSYDSTQTVKYFLKSGEVSKLANHFKGAGRSYAKLASYYTKYNEIDLIEKYLQLSAEYYIKVEDGNNTIAHYYNEVGNKLWDHNPKKSMDFYLKGMEYSDTNDNLKVSLGKAYYSIGDPHTALQYLKPTISNLRKRKNYRIFGIATGILGEIYIEIGDFAAADKVCDEVITILTPLGRSSQRVLPAIYRIKGLSKELQGNDELALEYFTKSIEVGNRISNRFELVKSNLAIGAFYLSRAPQKGEIFCEKALKKAQKHSFTNLEMEACDCLYKIHKKNESHENALKFYEKRMTLNDSISTLKVEHALDINNELAKKNILLAEESYQKEIKIEQLKNQYKLNTMLLIASMLGLALIGFLMLGFKRISKQNKEITKKTEELESVNLSLSRSNEENIKKTKALESANLNLGRSNEELERFAYVASHDLKSPLNTIVSFTSLLRRKLGDDLNPSVEESLNFIENSGKRMRQLIADILEYSKLSSSITSESEQEVISLNELVDEISQLIVNNPNGKLVTIEADDLPDLKWNYSKLFLLFKNLIENGLKYNKSEQPTIKVKFTNIDGIHLVSVEDNGIGIKKEYFDKVFIMFQRLHGQSEYDGTGLGLATCKKIVDEFKGKISINSEVGKGTTFKVELPKNLISHKDDANQTQDLVHDLLT